MSYSSSVSSRRDVVASLIESAKAFDSYDDVREDQEMMMTALSQGSSTAKKPPFELCRELLQLSRVASTVGSSSDEDEGANEDEKKEDSATAATVRAVLGNIQSSEASKLAEALGHLMEDRVDAQDLLPSTYDHQANLDAMENDAMTLTRSAMVSAQLYAYLLSVPGALGAGLVQLQALSALAALLKRWRMECCGRESGVLQDTAPSTIAKASKRSSRDVRNGNEAGDDEEGAYQPLKRSRRPVNSDDEEDEESDGDSDVALVVEELPSNSISPRQLVTMGLQVAKEASGIPAGKEFMSWSSEARDIVIDIVTCVMGTASALTAVTATRQHRKDDVGIIKTGNSVVARASSALTQCIVRSGYQERDSHSDSLTKRHETSKSILRGLLPLITMKDVVPKGEAGKQAAATNASNVLACFIEKVVEDVAESPSKLVKDGQAMKTPARPSSARTPSNHKTPLSTGNRRRNSMRVSLGEGEASTGTPQSTTILSPPKLKGCRTPSSSVGTNSNLSTSTRKIHPVLSVIVGALQALASNRQIEKASIRVGIVDALYPCIEKLPTSERSYFLTFLLRLSHSKVPSHRQLASELMGKILVGDWLWKEQSMVPISATPGNPSPSRQSLSMLTEGSVANTPGALLGALYERLVDRVPAIRASSANIFANLCRRLLDDWSTDTCADQLVRALSPRAFQVARRLRGRCVSDDKATVRKASLSALAELLLVAEEKESIALSICEEDLLVLGRLCCDSSVLTRKSSAEALTRILEWFSQGSHSPDELLQDIELAWTKSVLPLALDSENTCVSKSVDLFDRIVLDPILQFDEEEFKSRILTSWRILAIVTSGQQGQSSNSSDALRSVFKAKGVAATDRSAVLNPLLKAIHSAAIDTLKGDDLFEPTIEARRSGVWCLFNATMDFSAKDPSEISRLLKRKKIGLDFLVECWEKMLHLFKTSDRSDGQLEGVRGSMKNCLTVMSALAAGFDGPLGTKFSNDLERLLSTCHLPVDVIGPAVRALTTITASTCDSHDIGEACAVKVRSLLTACEDEIASQVGTVWGDDVGESNLVRAIFTTGELNLVGFSEADDEPSSKKTTQFNNDPLRGFYERPTSRLVDLVQAFLPKTLPGSDNILSPEVIRAHAFLALGKICLRDEKLASKSLFLLARELHENMHDGNAAVQSNALLILGDLCVRYTNLVDRFLPMMAACLQAGITDLSRVDISLATTVNNGFALVRAHAIRLLSSLLIQDYIKWRGLLFHRFLVATSDEDEEVADTAEMILCGPLLTKQPKLFSNNFVESLFVLNRCTAHPMYKTAQSAGDGGSGIAVGFDGIELSGDIGRIRRRQMYELMLSRMSPEQKIEVTARIAKDVLGNALEDGSELNRVCGVPKSKQEFQTSGEVLSPDEAHERAYDVLSDAFHVLSSKSIRISRSNVSVGADGDDDEPPQHGGDPNITQNATSRQRAVAAKGRLLSKLSRKHLIEIVIPILVNLKGLLQRRCSPLLKDLMSYLVGVYDLYKAEVKDLLSADANLLQELEYDLRQHKKNKAGQGQEQQEDEEEEN